MVEREKSFQVKDSILQLSICPHQLSTAVSALETTTRELFKSLNLLSHML